MPQWVLRVSLLVAASVLGTGAAADQSGDPVRGQQVYKKCASCHMVGADARNRVGPPLNNILNTVAGSAPGFRYSRALDAMAADGLHWTPDTLDAFLTSPRAFMPGTKMSFRGLTTDADRTDVIAYLTTFSGGSMAAQVDEGFTVAGEILAIEGDIEYGEYLASECTACHRVDGDNDGIPGIIGWQTADFVTAMHAYKEKHRDNPVMQMVTGRLANDEIAALAVYFQSLDN